MQLSGLRANLTDARRILIANDGGGRAHVANISQERCVVVPGLIGHALQHSALAVMLPAPVHAGTIEIETDVGRRTLNLR